MTFGRLAHAPAIEQFGIFIYGRAGIRPQSGRIEPDLGGCACTVAMAECDTLILAVLAAGQSGQAQNESSRK
jgi:hypothetical protein